ncbi:alpha/beta fold hydrolase [Dyadobacter psychrotolerans]|uniref:Alpha/beta fold hydrolase n=1 Tax=Dyadobacter psychrotolerans TaxID=2541721 RepID=A0A4V2Z360_9BACT|nr:alpha/beta fold hydrolase [Dyadobacter psychrotolerans]TDE10768.1 alpha/beta fold hydrolase [Dyadobacter psychrotolerans]
MKLSLIQAATYVLTLFLLSSCSDDDVVEIPVSPKTFVLVHGSFQGPFAWQYVKDQLIKKGQKVVVVELPAHGEDKTAPATVSIDVYRDKVISVINPLEGKVILVGHSLAGLVISATAEKVPDKIEKLVYIAGFVPANGQSLLDLSSTDSTSLLGHALIPSADQLTLDIAAANVAPIFAQDGSADIKKLLMDNKRVEPAIPFINKVAVSAANFGKVAKYYIHTAKDMAVGPALQKRMVAAAPGFKKTYTLDTSHSPFLTQPQAVTDILMEVSKL